ncbi:MAG: hypothetical protein RLZZ13_128, partial [Pseudomonadota bacterium]
DFYKNIIFKKKDILKANIFDIAKAKKKRS